MLKIKIDLETFEKSDLIVNNKNSYIEFIKKFNGILQDDEYHLGPGSIDIKRHKENHFIFMVNEYKIVKSDQLEFQF